MSIYVEQLVAKEPASQTENLVLIHGWGMGSEIWQQWLPLLNQCHNIHLFDLPGFGNNTSTEWPGGNQLLEAIDKALPENAVVVGFSLGGMLAVKLAERFPGKIKALITIASNATYVQRDQWPEAMPEKTYQAFYQLVSEKTELAMKRFSGFLVKGANDEKALLKSLRHLNHKSDSHCLSHALLCLSALDNRQTIKDNPLPSLYLFGEKDILVPVDAAHKLAEQTPGCVEVINQAPHAPFLSHPEATWQKIKAFLSRLEEKKSLTHIDKKLVAKSFSQAAPSYDSAADLQRRVGEVLLNKMGEQAKTNILDLGCGTGYFTKKLATKMPSANLFAIDIAQGMLNYSREAHNGIGQWLCGDAESLPIANESIDGIFSSLVIQWCENNDALFQELYRVLKPGGQCYLATLGPNTLCELRQAWACVDDYVHVNQFFEKEILQTAWQQASFQQQEFFEQDIVLEYKKLSDLTRELKALGAHNINSGRPSGLMGKKRMQQFIEGYEQQRNTNGLLPASYQAWWIVLQK